MNYHFITIEGNIKPVKQRSLIFIKNTICRIILEQLPTTLFCEILRKPKQNAFPLGCFMAKDTSSLKTWYIPRTCSKALPFPLSFTKCLLLPSKPAEDFTVPAFVRYYTPATDIDILIYLHKPVSNLQANIRKPDGASRHPR